MNTDERLTFVDRVILTDPSLPKQSRYYRHRNGNLYCVMFFVNQHAQDPDRYPLLVVYMDHYGRKWAKSPERFNAGMTLTDNVSFTE